MTRRLSLLGLAVWGVFVFGNGVAAQCVPFQDSLNDASSVSANGGVIVGPVSFAPGINSDGADVSSGGFIRYDDSLYNSDSGSVSLWVNKDGVDSTGGLFQIGQVGTPNSVGLFYASSTTVILEVRDNSGSLAQASSSNALTPNDWTHVAALWRSRTGGFDLFIFINGRFVASSSFVGDLNLTAGRLELGRTSFHGTAAGVIDEATYSSWDASDDEIYAEYVFSSNRFLKQATNKPASAGSVVVSGKQLLVDGQPFTVKGVGYQPTPIGTPISGSALAFMYNDQNIIARDMAILRAMNVNTIRIYSGEPMLNENLLDACYNDGLNPIYVIMGFFITAEGGIDYSNPTTATDLETDFRAFVNRFKDHPAVLAWGIGNENNLPYPFDISDWYTLANDLSQAAFEEEGASYHPTMVINGGMRDFGDVDLSSDDASIDKIDIWGHNAYPGEDYECYFDYFDRLSDKPLIITEFGIDSYNNQTASEYESVQSQFDVDQWRDIEVGAVGGIAFEYADEWWKAGTPAVHNDGGFPTREHPDGFSNEEWWGLLRTVDNGGFADILQPRDAYFAMADEFQPAVLPANFLTNPGFDLQSGSRLGWEKFGNTFVESTVSLTPPASGKLFGNFTGSFNTSGFFQAFPTLEGTEWGLSLSSHVRSADPLVGSGEPNDNWVLARIAFFDAGGSEISGEEVVIADGTVPQNVWRFHSVQATAPAGTREVQALVLFNQPQNAGGSVFVDDLVFGSPTPGDVPAMSTWGLVILTLMLLTAATVILNRRNMPHTC